MALKLVALRQAVARTRRTDLGPLNTGTYLEREYIDNATWSLRSIKLNGIEPLATLDVVAHLAYDSVNVTR